ncbi:hypothetical protein CEXT_365771 [Caerostris extrusa]|uniref:Uncharacterized protein n=1 Tax=Caerostris extrusa TaxID=172846 RepID=A0AAV4NPX4_CAEEX|nr:hypothetical protein CEXT_365771 [Caerostris extrusa]
MQVFKTINIHNGFNIPHPDDSIKSHGVIPREPDGYSVGKYRLLTAFVYLDWTTFIVRRKGHDISVAIKKSLPVVPEEVDYRNLHKPSLKVWISD